MFEDISADYRTKTATSLKSYLLQELVLSVRKWLDNEEGKSCRKNKSWTVSETGRIYKTILIICYGRPIMIVFLKLITSVTPSIQL
ncbi:BAF_HP2_G0030160.mRNA.1.CDS.1 [Saccharomyces cerevisiae]|nr:BAF_HP2_G0030160.mRNA.1.CDS.1 [Saccharomyces cerevisiae]CAI6455196.1 BAF_HP2_G0030160.mRNA.1.CDS.1 [Saccharomyces cerevisiae]